MKVPSNWRVDSLELTQDNLTKILNIKLTYRLHQALVIRLAKAFREREEISPFILKLWEKRLGVKRPLSSDGVIRLAIDYHGKRFMSQISANYAPTLGPTMGESLDEYVREIITNDFHKLVGTEIDEQVPDSLLKDVYFIEPVELT